MVAFLRSGIAAVLVSLLLFGCAPAPDTFHGDDLLKTPAPNFTLLTPEGKAVALRDWRGNFVVLTFVYTQCTDVCPLIAHKLSEVYSELGSDASRVKFIAISTAPELDTPVAIANFSLEQGMMGKWTYLSGRRAQLAPVWKDYYIDVESGVRSDSPVVHQSRVIVIDPEGNERVNYSPDLRSEDLLNDLRILLTRG